MSKPKQAETIFYSEGKSRHSFLNVSMSMLRNSEMFSPNIVLIAMRTTEVGVETFSLILNIMSLNRRLREDGCRLPEQKREDGEGADVHSAARNGAEDSTEESNK